MLNIKILGPGCANCKRLDQMVHQVLENLGAEGDVAKLTQTAEFIDYDVMSTPGLVINGATVSSGRIPSLAELTGFIESALASDK